MSRACFSCTVLNLWLKTPFINFIFISHIIYILSQYNTNKKVWPCIVNHTFLSEWYVWERECPCGDKTEWWIVMITSQPELMTCGRWRAGDESLKAVINHCLSSLWDTCIKSITIPGVFCICNKTNNTSVFCIKTIDTRVIFVFVLKLQQYQGFF